MTKFLFKVGDKFGKWTVIDENYKCLTKARAAHYLCRCDCGQTEKYVNASNLQNRKSPSCNKCTQYIGINDLSGTFISVIKKGARTRNLEYTITNEYLYDLYLSQNKKCNLSGVEIKFHPSYSSGYRKEQTASLDRIDNTKGYIEGNVQWLHVDVNMMKRSYSQEYFIELCKKIAEHDNNK